MCNDFEPVREIREKCIRLLTRREHSQRELLDKLGLKGFDRSEIQLVIDMLIDEGWQSDERFAESYTRYRIRKGFGPVKIAYELRQRGIVGFNLDPVVLDLTGSWFNLVEQVYHKKFGDNKPSSEKEWLKQSRFLQQRGFTHELIKTVIS